jgi:glycosyltransferase involved in cell wall biosynthesis
LRLSVVIRCHNEERHIGRLLSGILVQTRDAEIVVVDSGSTDATLAIAARYPIKLVEIAPSEFSFGRALNLGCAAASGDVLVFASAHVYPVYQDWLETLAAPFEAPDVALVYGKQRGDERTKYAEHRVFARWFPDKANPDQRDPFCNNANCAVRRSVWESLPYEETLTGLEDLDWAKRALAAGWRLCYTPEAEIVHVHEESWNKIYNRYRREAIAFKRIFPEQRFGLWDFARMFAGNTLYDWRHALADGMLTGEAYGVLRFRLSQFWGTYRGYQQTGTIDQQLRRRFYYPEIRQKALQKSHRDKARVHYEQHGESAAMKD